MEDLEVEWRRIIEANETKFLGAIIDNKLNWNILSDASVRQLQAELALYCKLESYSTHLSDPHVFQNMIIRIINGVLPRTNNGYLYMQQGISSVNRLYFYQNMWAFMYKYSNSMFIEMFDYFFNEIEDSHSYHTRQPTENFEVL